MLSVKEHLPLLEYFKTSLIYSIVEQACQCLYHFVEMINIMELPPVEHLFFQPILEKHHTRALNPV